MTAPVTSAAAGTRDRLRPWPAAALVAWTLLTWTGRIGLAWGDDALTTTEKVVATVPIVVFVALAVVAGAALLRRADAPALTGTARTVVLALAGWSVAYWAVRLPFILANDHPGGFKVVHTVLAVVAGGLGLATLAFAGFSRASGRGPRRARA